MAIDAKTTLARLTACLALVGAPAAYAAELELEIGQQPSAVKRGELVDIAWTGAAAEVVVEHKHGLDWVARASSAADEILTREVDGDGWTARWQPTYYTPAGTYRIRLEGESALAVSEEFKVRPCRCVLPNRLRAKRRKGRYKLSVTADYAPGPARGYQALPRRVTTGRPLVRVFRDGRRIGSVRLRYRRGKFRGTWRGPRNAPRNALIFQLIALSDGFGNR